MRPSNLGSPPPENPSDGRRHVLIALNASQLGRATICHLGRDLDDWVGLPARSLPSLARSLGVAPAEIERAQSIVSQAGEIAQRELEKSNLLGAKITTLLDSTYPSVLLELALPPPVLYYRGELSAEPGVAIVGPRNADPYGREVARHFARSLASQGLVVVSGLARGVDAVAHRSAMEAPGGRTLAVLGCGLGINYPRQNSSLHDEIPTCGTIMTEFPVECPPKPWHFPVRNRLIAALSEGTLVVQASLRSGALITARYALDLGREVWAVPGRIFDIRSAGTNALIRDGAQLAEHPRDIVEGLSLSVRSQLRSTRSSPTTPTPSLGAKLDGLLANLEPGHTFTLEEISQRVEQPIEEILPRLLELELQGWIERHPGPCFLRLA